MLCLTTTCRRDLQLSTAALEFCSRRVFNRLSAHFLFTSGDGNAGRKRGKWCALRNQSWTGAALGPRRGALSLHHVAYCAFTDALLAWNLLSSYSNATLSISSPLFFSSLLLRASFGSFVDDLFKPFSICIHGLHPFSKPLFGRPGSSWLSLPPHKQNVEGLISSGGVQNFLWNW